MLIAFAIAFSLLILLLIIIAVKSPAENYIDPAGPLYTGSYAGETQPFNGSLKVISWNMNFATRVDQAIEAFRNIEELRDADIILLQEMDEAGAEKIAQALQYNFVYFPSAVHRRHNRKFGNAILSKWPLLEPQKFILSDSLRGLKHNRIAVRALVNFGVQKVATYSVHMDMVWMLPGQKNSQLDLLVDRVGEEDAATVVGGDFNSWSPGSVDKLEERFREIGLWRVSQDTGPTIETYGGLKLTLDHIFASEIFSSQAGIWHNTNISDHAALWVILQFEGTK